MPKSKSIVWNHFSEYLDDKQILHGKCKYCGITYVSNAKRMEIHLTKCNKCPDAIKESYVAAKNCNSSLLKDLSSKKTSQSNLNNFIDKIPIEKKDKMDKMLARTVYSSCSPFRLVENDYLKKFLKLSSPGYIPPSKDQLSGRLLDEEYQLLKSVMKNKLENANSLTILSDGWTDINRCSIINIVFMAPEPIFYKAIDASSESHTGTFIAGILSTAIEEVGPHKVHALVTDNAKNMKAAWGILENDYPHLITFGCVAHGLNLLVKDVLSLTEIEEIIDKSKKIIKFFLNHTLLYSVLKDTQRQKTNEVLHLLLPIDTRWGSYNSSLNSLLRIKESLQIATFDKNVSKMITEEMRQDIRDDSYFWPMVQNVHDLIEIPCSVIKCLEGEYPTLLNLSKKLTDMYGNFIEKSYFLEEKSQSYVEDKYLDRKDFISHPVYFAAHLLNPQLFNCPLVEADKIEAVNFIEKFAENLELNSQQVITDLGDYCTQQAVWSNKSLWTESKISNSITWWKLYFSNRDLAKLVVIILNIPATSAACERNWSVFGNIKTKKRNRLSVEKTEKLVFVKSNLCLLDDDCLLQASNNNILIAEISNASETVVIDSTIDQDLDDVEEPEYLNLEEIMDWEVDENCNIEMISG